MKNKLTAIKLDHDSYISLHTQLHNSLRQLIVSGRWKYGERIPGEAQIANHLKISRTTVRIALQKAEIEGLIRRAAGRGTFVAYQRDSGTNPSFIGFVTRSFHNEIHRVLLSSAEAELRSAGYRVIFSNARNNDDEVAVLHQLLHEDEVAGLLLWPNANPTPAQIAMLQQYELRQIPVVFIDRLAEGIKADFVTSDNFGGMYALVEHLIELNHEHIVFLRHNIRNLFPADERQRGYETALRDHGMQPCAIWQLKSPDQSEFVETDIYELLDETNAALTQQIIELMENTTPKPTAIACMNDALAIIAMRAIRQMGLQVPEDISITGFDDISIAAYMDVPLTTATQNAHEIGTLAAKLIQERHDGSTLPPQTIFVPTRLQIRKSTSTRILKDQDDRRHENARKDSL